MFFCFSEMMIRIIELQYTRPTNRCRPFVTDPFTLMFCLFQSRKEVNVNIRNIRKNFFSFLLNNSELQL